MAIQKCAVCGEMGTPWESCKELGVGFHMCCDCAYLKPIFERAFAKYMGHVRLESDFNGGPVIDIMKPRAIKKMTYLLIRRWYNERIKK